MVPTVLGSADRKVPHATSLRSLCLDEPCLVYGVWGVGFRVWGVGFGVCRVWGLGFGVWALGPLGLGFFLSGFRVYSSLGYCRCFM